jgi:hypothetical protein
MKLTKYSCDAEGCTFSTEDKKMLITYVFYTVSSDKKGRTKAVRHEKHYCKEACLVKERGIVFLNDGSKNG